MTDLMSLAAVAPPERARPKVGVYAYRSVETVSGTPLAYLPLHAVTWGQVLNGVGTFQARLKLPPLGSKTRSTVVFDDSYSHVYTETYSSPSVVESYDHGAAVAGAYVDATDPLRRCVYVERDGVVMDGYVIVARSWDHDTQELVVVGASLWALLRRRRIRWNVTFTATDQLAIARSLITRAQQSTGGDLGIAVGSETSGRVRDRTYVAYEDKPLAEAIEQLSEVIDGFDFEIDVERTGDSYTRTLRLHYPRKGRVAAKSGHVWTLGANMLLLDWPEDAQRTANSIAALGAGEGLSMLRSVQTDTTVLALGFPLLEDSLSLKDVSVAATLNGHARQALADQRLPFVLPRATVLADAAPTVDGVEVGDDAHLVVRPGTDPRWPAGLNAVARIVERSVSPPDDGEPATVELIFEEVT